jgi:hypothetical protein
MLLCFFAALQEIYIFKGQHSTKKVSLEGRSEYSAPG